MTEINVPLMRKDLEHITEHLDDWRQQWWASRTACGTALCFAGWAVVLADPDAKLYWAEAEKWSGPWGVPPCGHETCAAGAMFEASMLEDGRYIRDVARKLLGLGVWDANLLFRSSNRLTDLWRIASEITDGAITIPEDIAEQIGKQEPPW